MNIAQLASQLKSTQAALILSEENRLYFTGFPSSNGTLLVMPEESAFVTDSRYFEAASNTVTEAQVLLQDQVYQQVFDLLQKHSCTEILVESERMTLSELNKWRKMLPTYSFNVSNRLDTLANELREVKCEAEVEKMQRAQDIAEKALEELLHILKPGVAERDLANELEYLMRKFGADGISFDTIVVSGANSSKPHGVPGEKLVETGDFVTIDFGAIYDHYHSDCTRTFAVGRPDISTQVRFRKEEDILKRKKSLLSDQFDGNVRILTACPGCLQGISRYSDRTGTGAEFLVVEMARLTLGKNWIESFVKQVKKEGIEGILL